MIVAYLILLVAFVDNFAMLPTVAPYAEGLGDRAPLQGRGRAMGRAGAVIGAAAVLAPRSDPT